MCVKERAGETRTYKQTARHSDFSKEMFPCGVGKDFGCRCDVQGYVHSKTELGVHRGFQSKKQRIPGKWH